VKYCCLFRFVLILRIKIHKGWDMGFEMLIQPYNGNWNIQIPVTCVGKQILNNNKQTA